LNVALNKIPGDESPPGRLQRPSYSSADHERFVRVPQHIYEAITRARMSATQLQVFLAVGRRIYGYGATSAAISRSLLILLTGRSERGVRNALTDLVGEGVLRVVDEHRGSHPAVLEINTDCRSWGRFSVKSEPRHRGHEGIPAAPALEGSSRTPLEGPPGTPTKDKKIEERLGGAKRAPRQAGSCASPSDLLALVEAALDGKGLDPRLPAPLREAIRRGGATPEMINSFAQDEEGTRPRN